MFSKKSQSSETKALSPQAPKGESKGEPTTALYSEACGKLIAIISKYDNLQHDRSLSEPEKISEEKKLRLSFVEIVTTINVTFINQWKGLETIQQEGMRQPLLHAALRWPDILTYLLNNKNKIDINIQDSQGNTALHRIFDLMDEKTAALSLEELLTKHEQLLPGVKNKDQKTAFEIAISKGKYSLAFKLLPTKIKPGKIQQYRDFLAKSQLVRIKELEIKHHQSLIQKKETDADYLEAREQYLNLVRMRGILEIGYQPTSFRIQAIHACQWLKFKIGQYRVLANEIKELEDQEVSTNNVRNAIILDEIKAKLTQKKKILNQYEAEIQQIFIEAKGRWKDLEDEDIVHVNALFVTLRTTVFSEKLQREIAESKETWDKKQNHLSPAQLLENVYGFLYRTNYQGAVMALALKNFGQGPLKKQGLAVQHEISSMQAELQRLKKEALECHQQAATLLMDDQPADQQLEEKLNGLQKTRKQITESCNKQVTRHSEILKATEEIEGYRISLRHTLRENMLFRRKLKIQLAQLQHEYQRIAHLQKTSKQLTVSLQSYKEIQQSLHQINDENLLALLPDKKESQVFEEKLMTGHKEAENQLNIAYKQLKFYQTFKDICHETKNDLFAINKITAEDEDIQQRLGLYLLLRELYKRGRQTSALQGNLETKVNIAIQKFGLTFQIPKPAPEKKLDQNLSSPAPKTAGHFRAATAPGPFTKQKPTIKPSASPIHKESKEERVEVDVPADGSCLFYSLVFSTLLPAIKEADPSRFHRVFINLFGDNLTKDAENDLKELLKRYNGDPEFIPKHASALEILVDVHFRQRLVDFIKTNKSIYDTAEYNEAKDDFNDSLWRMSKPKTWGGNREIVAASQFLQQKITVYRKKKEGELELALQCGSADTAHLALVHTTSKPGGKQNNHFHYLIAPQYLQLAQPTTPAQRNTSTKPTESKGGDPTNLNASPPSGLGLLPKPATPIEAAKGDSKGDSKLNNKTDTALQKPVHSSASLSAGLGIFQSAADASPRTEIKLSIPSTRPIDINLLQAVKEEKIKLSKLKKLILDGASAEAVNEEGNSVLIVAATRGHLDVVKWLVTDCKAKVNEKNADGFTAFLTAAVGDHTEVAKFLLKNGAKLDARDNKGNTALLLAARGNNQKVIKWLLEEKLASINEHNTEHQTALSWAAYFGHLATVDLLFPLANKIINLADKNGCTALHWAAGAGHLNIVKSLLERGAKMLDTKAGTPFQLAVKQGCLEITEFFLQDKNIHHLHYNDIDIALKYCTEAIKRSDNKLIEKHKAIAKILEKHNREVSRSSLSSGGLTAPLLAASDQGVRFFEQWEFSQGASSSEGDEEDTDYSLNGKSGGSKGLGLG